MEYKDFSIAIISYNSERNIENLLKCINKFSEILVVDNNSTDGTTSVVKKYTNNIFFNSEKDFIILREYALSKSKSDWVLFLDTDETIDKNDIERLVSQFRRHKKNKEGFWLKRKNFFGNEKNEYLKHGLFQDDYQLRLIKKNTEYINTPHEEPNIDKSKTYFLKDVFINHYLDKSKLFSITGFLKNLNTAKIHAKNITDRSYLYLFFQIFYKFFDIFFVSLIRGKGILDGKLGIIATLNFALHISSLYLLAIYYKVTEKKLTSIAIDAGNYNFKTPVKTGTERYVQNFYLNVKNILGYRFNFYYFEKDFGLKKTRRNNVFMYLLPKNFFASIFLPLKTILNQSDYFFGFSMYIPRILKFFKIKKILFVYDLGFFKKPEFYPNFKKLQSNLSDSLKIADKIIVPTEYVKDDLKKYFPKIKSDNVEIVRPGIDHLLNKTEKINEKYFLYLGGIKKTKNIEKILHLYSEFIFRNPKSKVLLYLVGAVDNDYFLSLKKQKIFKKIKNKVKIFENLKDSQINNYLYNCQSVINVSIEEGLCFPVLEATALGVPIIVNDLALYFEYQKFFTNINICISDEDFLNKLNYYSKNFERKMPDLLFHDNFDWNVFSLQILNLIK